MTRHLSVRLAWHDNDWNGHVCSDPAGNVYCTGAHSLLSDRIARDKETDREAASANAPLDTWGEEYLPPCYWSSNAFSSETRRVFHAHPFQALKQQLRIPDESPPYSVYTWPFRLSFNHSKARKERDGSYPANLTSKIDHFQKRFEKRKSIVFFYLNSDNPVSADDQAFALVGCSLLETIQPTGDYSFERDELAKQRRRPNMQNFPVMNWALKVTHSFPQSGVMLPYSKYVNRLASDPSFEDKLRDIRVLVDDPAIVPGFKYVAEDLDDDQCLVLLYKLRKAFERVAEHAIVDPGDAIARIDSLLALTWSSRGIFPGLPACVDFLADLAEFGTITKATRPTRSLIDEAVDKHSSASEAFEALWAAIINGKAAWATSTQAKALLQFTKGGSETYADFIPALRRLSLINLSKSQISRLLNGDDALQPSLAASNPYLCCEDQPERDATDADLDELERPEETLDFFNVDLGMFPDSRFVTARTELHDLTPASPFRLRAFTVASLRQRAEQGDAYASEADVVDELKNSPIIHQEELVVSARQLLSASAKEHLSQRLHIAENAAGTFYYLKEIRGAEETIERVVTQLVERKDRKHDEAWITDQIGRDIDQLKQQIIGFDSDDFRAERTKAYQGALRRSMFLLTGIPGSGKTRSLKQLVDELTKAGERVTFLAPTGKAALRVRQEVGVTDAQTIDYWISKNGLREFANDLRRLPNLKLSDKYDPVTTLFIDEMSMVDLPKLAVVFKALEVQGLPKVKRIILVGDEFQLPPIGCGRPFYDLVQFLTATQEQQDRHYVRLTTNCRQAFDPLILKAARLFADNFRYHDEILAELERGGQLSPGLEVKQWSTSEDLSGLINNAIDEIAGVADATQRFTQFNISFGLYGEGNLPSFDTSKLRLDNWQIVSPYRAGIGGTLRTNQNIFDAFKGGVAKNKVFGHSEKLIRLSNLYSRTGELILSNGSIGVLCRTTKGWQAFFPERANALWLGDEDDYDRAYAITVHKSQGSDFGRVILVLPRRFGLLNRELMYTALTRSRNQLSVFVQRGLADQPSTFVLGRRRSALLSRNSSVLTAPSDNKHFLTPEAGVNVKSRIEYVLYASLMRARDSGRLSFSYEQELTIPFLDATRAIHPDFTINCGGATYYWEHLGRLDTSDYSSDWSERRAAYERGGFGEQLITTDDLSGIRQDRIDKVIAQLESGQIQADSQDFSRAHYRL